MSMGEILGLGVAALTPLGAAGAFIWNKLEKRFERLETKLEECETRETDSLERRAVTLTAVELLWQEVARNVPDSMALVRAKKLLDGLKDENDEARR